MTESVRSIETDLAALADPDYRVFQLKLIPGVPPERVLGVRIPALRRYARMLDGTSALSFMQALPHASYDADNLHALLIAQMRDYNEIIAALEEFLPFIDNWATCDICRPAMPPAVCGRLRPQIDCWMAAPRPYTVRFGIEQLMLHFLDDRFAADDLDAVIACAAQWADEYYIVMMAAWYLATALITQEAAVLDRLAAPAFPTELRRKTVRKAVESRRISPALKAYLRTI